MRKLSLLCGAVLFALVPSLAIAAGFYPVLPAPESGWPSSPTFSHVGTNTLTAVDNASGSGTADLKNWRDAFINRNITGAGGGTISGYYVGGLKLSDNTTLDNMLGKLSAGSETVNLADVISKGPHVDLRSFMDGQAGRNTLAAWQADNTTDVTAAFNAALSAAGSQKPLLLPGGKIRLSSAIGLNSRNKVYGSGRGATFIENLVSDVFVAAGSGTVSDVALADFTILGLPDNTSTATAIKTNRMEYLDVSRVNIQYFYYGVFQQRLPAAQQCVHNSFSDMRIRDTKYGIFHYSPDDGSDFGSVNVGRIRNVVIEAIAYTWSNTATCFTLGGYGHVIDGLYTHGCDIGFNLKAISGQNLVAGYYNEQQEAGHHGVLVSGNMGGANPSKTYFIGTHGDGSTFTVEDSFDKTLVVNDALDNVWNWAKNYVSATWTPGIKINGSDNGITYEADGQRGGYTRIGDYIYFYGWIQLTSKGTEAGNVTITGLPILSYATGRHYGVIQFTNYGGMASITGLNGYINQSVQEVTLLNNGTTAAAPLTDANLSNSSYMAFGGFYRVQ